MESRPGLWKIGSQYGLLIGIVLTLYEFARFAANLQDSVIFGLLDFLFLIIGIAWVHRAFKKTASGFMSYGEGLGLGTIASGIAGLVSGVFVYAYLKFVDPEALSRLYEQQQVLMQDRGASDQEVEMMEKITSIMQLPGVMLFGTFMGYLLTGFVLSLIIAAITKKNNPAEEL